MILNVAKMLNCQVGQIYQKYLSQKDCSAIATAARGERRGGPLLLGSPPDEQ